MLQSIPQLKCCFFISLFSFCVVGAYCQKADHTRILQLDSLILSAVRLSEEQLFDRAMEDNELAESLILKEVGRICVGGVSKYHLSLLDYFIADLPEVMMNMSQLLKMPLFSFYQ